MMDFPIHFINSFPHTTPDGYVMDVAFGVKSTSLLAYRGPLHLTVTSPSNVTFHIEGIRWEIELTNQATIHVIGSGWVSRYTWTAFKYPMPSQVEEMQEWLVKLLEFRLGMHLKSIKA